MNGDDPVETTQPDEIAEAHNHLVLAFMVKEKERNVRDLGSANQLCIQRKL